MFSGVMASRSGRLPENARGSYYVDESCIDCLLCSDIAPGIFIHKEEMGYHVVGKQPETGEEVEQAFDALESCPTEAIGNDGED